jgi:hypothetical protein
MFSGGTVRKEFMQEENTWGDYIRMFLFCCDRETGSVGVSPMEIMGWPYRFFLIFFTLQNLFLAYIKKEQDKVKRKSSQGRKPPRRRV